MTKKVLQSEDDDSAKKAGTQENNQQVTVSNPEEFDVKEVEELSDDQGVEIEDGGIIDLGKLLDPLEKLERSRMRIHITYLMFSLLAARILIGLTHFLLTGNSFLLASSFPMSIPILIIIRYYFRSG
jgi:hypothetical protein